MNRCMHHMCITVVAASLAMLLGSAQAQTPEITWEFPKPPTNAALVLYRAFIDLQPLGDKDNKAEDKAFEKLIEKGEYDAKRLDPYVERNDAAVLSLLHAAEIEECDFGVQFDQGAAALLPELARGRELARLGTTAMRRAMELGDWSRAVDLFDAVLRLARGVHGDGTLIGALVGVAVIDIVNSQSGRLLGTMPADSVLYDRLETALAKTATAVADWSIAIEGERKLHATIFPPPGKVLTHEEILDRVNDVYRSYPKPSEDEPSRDAVRRVAQGTSSPKDREEVAKMAGCAAEELATPEGISAVLTRQGVECIGILNEIDAALALPYLQGQPALAAIMAKVPTLGPAPRAFLPALGAMYFYKAKAATRLAMLQTALAAMRYKAANGKLPGVLAEAPSLTVTDPCTDGQPFAYSVLEKDAFTLTGKGAAKRDTTTPLTLTVLSSK